MKSKTVRTGFDRYFSERMKDREFAADYQEARQGIDSVDAFMRSLEEARTTAGVSKAELAKLPGTQPAAMRRLLTTDSPNPTFMASTPARSIYSPSALPEYDRGHCFLPGLFVSQSSERANHIWRKHLDGR
jgi:hypothetical protein